MKLRRLKGYTTGASKETGKHICTEHGDSNEPSTI